MPLRHQVTKIPPVVPDITEYRRHALGCLNCGKITRASLPEGVSPSSFGPRLGALTAVCTAKYRMSKRAVKELLTDFLGVHIALGTVTRIERQASLALAEATKEAHVEIESAQVVNADETSWVEGKAKAWLWVAVTYCLAVFKIARGRGKADAKKILGTRFSGYLGSDRWSGYAFHDVRCRQLCWAHLIRDFKLWTEYGGQSGKSGQALVDLSKTIFVGWHQFKEQQYSRERLRRKMRPLQVQVASHLRRVAASNAQKPAGMAKHILNLEPALWTFLRVPDLEPTNNVAERTIRHAVLMRKSSFGTDSEEGSRYVERMLTTMASLRLQNGNVLEFLTASIAAHRRGERGPSLVPHAQGPTEQKAA